MTRSISVAAGLAAAFAFVQPVAAQTTSINGKIAYTECGYNSSIGFTVCDIWSMNPDGTQPVNLTQTPDINEANPA